MSETCTGPPSAQRQTPSGETVISQEPFMFTEVSSGQVHLHLRNKCLHETKKL